MAVVSVPSCYERRRAEAARAAEILGCELRMLNDGGPRRIEDLKNYELVAQVDALVAELGPALVLSHSASEVHRDHVIVHNACLSSQRLQYFDFLTFHPTMCRPMPVPFHPRAYVDVTRAIEVKMAAAAAHASQFADRGIDLEVFRDFARMTGRLVGVGYAEALDVGRLLLS